MTEASSKLEYGRSFTVMDRIHMCIICQVLGFVAVERRDKVKVIDGLEKHPDVSIG